jgi:hypothetical protein
MRAERGDGAKAGSRVTRLLWCSLAGLATAMGLGTAASLQTPATLQTPPVVRVESGELQGVVADGVASFKGIPLTCGGGRPSRRRGGLRCARPRNSGRAACRDEAAGRLRVRVREQARLRRGALSPLPRLLPCRHPQPVRPPFRPHRRTACS